MSRTPQDVPGMAKTTARKADDRRIIVRPLGTEWAVQAHERTSSVHSSREDALAAADELVRSDGGDVVLRDADGRTRRSVVIGRRPFGRISAVEGLTPTCEARARTSDFDERGLTPVERRRAIIEAYRPPKG